MASSDHVQKNYEAFLKQLPELMRLHEGKFALMRDAQVVEYYDTMRDAWLVGSKLYEDGRFSIQEVTTRPINLGFWSHALPQP